MEKIGINLNGLISQIICFAILFGILFGFGYKPFLKMMDERSKKIKEGVESADKAKQQAEQAEQEFKKQVGEARKEGQVIMAQAVEMGERTKEEARQKAREEAEALIKRARGEIQLERDQAIDQLRGEFADLTILAAEKVINESLDKESHRRLIEETLKESATLRRN